MQAVTCSDKNDLSHERTEGKTLADHNEALITGEGEPLLLLHGMGFDATYWQLQARAFRTAYRVIAWNMPGYGGTQALAPMTFTRLGDRLCDFLDRQQIEKIHLLGHSMGAMLALDFAARFPDRVQSLILFAGSAAFPPPDSNFANAFVAAALAPLDAGGTMATLARDAAKRMLDPDADACSLERASHIVTTSMSACLPAVYRASVKCLTVFDRRAALAGIRVPALVLAAENDMNAPPKGVKRMATAIPGAEYVCIARAGHLANLEKPDEFNRIVRDFLARITA